jgi:hypothetical protein
MFWRKKENIIDIVPEITNEEVPLNQLHIFTVSYGVNKLSGISIEAFEENHDIAEQIIKTFYWTCNIPYYIKDYWRHAFIYHHDLPSSVSLAAIRERCYQHPVELQAFVDAVFEYKRATLLQEYVNEKLDALKEAKKNLLLVVV